MNEQPLVNRADVTAGSTPPPNAGSRASFYDRLGGAKSVREAVDRLYLLIFNDEQLVPYFQGKDMPLLKSHMAALLSKVLGGPDGYAGRDLAVAHQGLGITDGHFAKVTEYLVTVLLNMGADTNVVTAVSLTLASVKVQIVQQEAVTGEEAAMPGEHPSAPASTTPEGA